MQGVQRGRIGCAYSLDLLTHSDEQAPCHVLVCVADIPGLAVDSLDEQPPVRRVGAFK